MDERRLERKMAAWAAIFRFNGMTNVRLDAVLRSRAGMTLAEHELLAVLQRHGGRARMGELARDLMLSKSGVTRLVAKLEEPGDWVRRTMSPRDRRATWAELTPAGEKALEAAKPVFDAAVSEIFADALPDGELDRVTAALEHVIGTNGWTATTGSCAAAYAPVPGTRPDDVRPGGASPDDGHPAGHPTGHPDVRPGGVPPDSGHLDAGPGR
ncbi:MarR family winged helix-turn-helix transcriptional regulator [Streptosporangium vulgare]|uniref:MarR family winged helix-turn-helix transcriptional regulator n=1 Tax=Streptosporangium vulgare TaxID=46190 RepID=A0ABV5T9V2_9ACTN